MLTRGIWSCILRSLNQTLQNCIKVQIQLYLLSNAIAQNEKIVFKTKINNETNIQYLHLLKLFDIKFIKLTILVDIH